jgi:hypothetical protein
MPGSRTPGPTGSQPPSARPSPTQHRPGPVGSEIRFPTLEVFAALHGDLLSSEARGLTQRELDVARPIFASSIAYEAVRIVVAPFANAPTTLGNFIRVSPEIRRQGMPDSTLIHELTHIWQFQTRGMRYMSNSLCAQVTAIITEGDRNYAYDLTGTDVVRAGSIDRLPAEKQAMFVELWFMQGALIFPGASGAQRMREHPVCQNMIREVQAGRPLLLGQIIEEAAFGPGSGRMIPGAPGTERATPTVPLFRFDF